MSDLMPVETPNVVIENPKIRRGVNVFLGVAGVIVTIAWIVDMSIEQIDISNLVSPATQILVGISALFGLSVTVPNVPKVK